MAIAIQEVPERSMPRPWGKEKAIPRNEACLGMALLEADIKISFLPHGLRYSSYIEQ